MIQAKNTRTISFLSALAALLRAQPLHHGVSGVTALLLTRNLQDRTTACRKRTLNGLQERTEELKKEFGEVKENWERKKESGEVVSSGRRFLTLLDLSNKGEELRDLSNKVDRCVNESQTEGSVWRNMKRMLGTRKARKAQKFAREVMREIYDELHDASVDCLKKGKQQLKEKFDEAMLSSSKSSEHASDELLALSVEGPQAFNSLWEKMKRSTATEKVMETKESASKVWLVEVHNAVEKVAVHQVVDCLQTEFEAVTPKEIRSASERAKASDTLLALSDEGQQLVKRCAGTRMARSETLVRESETLLRELLPKIDPKHEDVLTGDNLELKGDEEQRQLGRFSRQPIRSRVAASDIFPSQPPAPELNCFY